MKKNIDFEKVDKFYLVLSVVLLLMTTLFVFSIKGAFNVFLGGFELNTSLATENVKVNKEKLNEAYNFAFRKSIIKLEVR